MGADIYSFPILILTATIVLWLTDYRLSTNDSSVFSVEGACLALFGVLVSAECYAIGSVTRSCNDVGFGVMYSSLILTSKPFSVFLTIGSAVALIGGGLLPRPIKLPRNRVIIVFAILACIAALTGFVTTPVSHQTCSPL